jgi:hypothetical protein
MAEEDSEYISVVQAVKLIPRNFNGNPKELREFCEGVESAKQVVHPSKYPLLLKFIESKITGEAKDRLLARLERNTWEQIKAILEENYAVKRTLEYYAGILFTSKQAPNESVAQWGSRIDGMGIDLMREARTRIERTNPQAVGGGNILVSELMKGSFISGLKDDRIKYIVKARGEDESLAQLVEIALQEESEIKSQRTKGNFAWAGPGYSGNFNREHRPQIKREVCATSVECYKCRRTGHLARDCRTRNSQSANEAPVCKRCHRAGHDVRNCRVRNSQGNY